MEDLFKEDRTINVGNTLSFMISSGEVNNIEENSATPIPSTSTEDDTINIVHSDIDNAHS